MSSNRATLRNGTAKNIPAADRKVTAKDNAPTEKIYTPTTFKADVIALGEAARNARDAYKAAGIAVKVTAADGMIAFTRAAEQDVLTETNFDEYFQLWTFGKPGELKLAHASERSRFVKAMKAGIAAKARGVSFVDTITNVKDTANAMIAARAAVSGDARKALPEARQADLAVYNVLNRMAEKAGDKTGAKGMQLLSEAELEDAIRKPPAKAKAAASTTIESMIEGMVKALNEMMGTLPKSVKSQARAAVAQLGEILDELESEEEDEAEAE